MSDKSTPNKPVKVNTKVMLSMKLPGTNQAIQLTKAHRWDFDKMKKKVTTEIIRELIQQKCVPVNPYNKIRVSYQFFEGKNSRDPDNVLFGLKFVHDAFTAVGIVEDDDLWHIELGGFKFTPGNEFRVVVTWEPIK